MINCTNPFSDQSQRWQKVFYVSMLTTFASLSSGPVLAQDFNSVTTLSGLSSSQKIALIKSTTALELLQTGIEAYETSNFAAAEKAWSESVTLFTRQSDILGQALALNNLALVYLQQGRSQEAKVTVEQALELLEDQTGSQQGSAYQEILGKTLNTLGNWQWGNGQTESALSNWQSATKHYEEANYQPGMVISQINQAKALQSLGLNIQAVKLLQEVVQNLASQPDSTLKATSLRYLGNGLRNIGQLEQSAQVLQQSLESSQSGDSRSTIWLELGNTAREQRSRLLAIGKQTAAELYWRQAREYYRKAEEFADSEAQKLSAQLNQFNLAIEVGNNIESLKLQSQLNEPIVSLAPSRRNIYAQINYAQSLRDLESQVDPVALESLGRRESPNDELTIADSQIIGVLNTAIANSRLLGDQLAEAQAVGQLAAWHESAQQMKTAQKLTQQALWLLEGKQATDIAYGLEWQLGRILKQRGESPQAIAAYQRAVDALEVVRQDILSIDSNVQFAFRDRVEPVYREFADLLLQTEGEQRPSQVNLHQAIKAIDALQLAELENFLGCNLSELIELNQTQIDPTAARIYPIILRDRFVTIIEIPGQELQYREVALSQSELENTLQSLRHNLISPAKTPEVLAEAQKVYQWLIAPLESLLAANSQLETLVFVPDRELRNIPLSILYDGEKYFLEQDYAIAIAPRLKLFAPKFQTAPLKVLTGGVDISQQIEGIGFPIIEQVKQELSQIAEVAIASEPLLNEQFTKSNIEKELQTGNFSAIHWKTHGVFSSDPKETFLVAYQDSIKAGELQTLVQTAIQSRIEPLELLVLSACETAQGDNRAVLGLAGLTVKTGAHSTLSTLWKADDRATTLLMTKFYQQLSLPGKTKAQALREAQLSLIREEGYLAPHYWATYLLVGNWL
ncbi:hypothetical protein Xen7305DRAFT_00002790 [Xenococcus sp. PCC 7305]|uniref:CHAT domain-containing protein n=1 Tax=Xenococcus sp. PCC 7305 TaxID=102125 RepID=UPI0002AC06B2|nr:CHAT domain-containing protein [Xenococcus sp. PCC 7305]ELS00578.1 hypothetical protein Xen7305DRAFT_00002790 [Xenococcus sp. PCC 7305]